MLSRRISVIGDGTPPADRVDMKTIAYLLLATSLLIGGCAAAPEESSATGNDALTGSVQETRLERIKEAYQAADVSAFRRLPDLFPAASLDELRVGVSDQSWFALDVAGETVVVHDFVADSDAMLLGGPSTLRKRESFVLIYELVRREVAADDAAQEQRIATFLSLALLYVPASQTWHAPKRDFSFAGTPIPDAVAGVR